MLVSFNRKRRNLTLGKVDRIEAYQFAANIEVLVSHRKQNPTSIPPSLESWVGSLSDRHRVQLGEIELLSRFDCTMTVAQLVEAFLLEYESRPDDQVRASTKKQFRSAMDNRILPKLGAVKVLQLEPKREHHRINAKPIFSEEAKAICRNLESWQRNHFSRSTWSRANGRIREIGVWAVENGICDYNPFTLLPKPGETNPERNVFVEREWVDDAMDMCLDSDTRLVFALGRYAGFRLPSEARTLKWRDVDFDKLQIRVLDSKKREYRTMPLFDRIGRELRLHREKTDSSRFVLTERFRHQSDSNNFGLMKEAINRAGVTQWVRLRQNLRSSFENDLLNHGCDERLVTLWLGHTIKVSRKHYQKMSDNDYIREVQKFRIQEQGSPE